MRQKMSTAAAVLLICACDSIVTSVARNVSADKREAEVKAATVEVSSIACAITAHQLVKSTQPKSLDQLVAEGRLRDLRNDPWGHPYVYLRIDESRFTVQSYGPDGQPGGGDDITADER